MFLAAKYLRFAANEAVRSARPASLRSRGAANGAPWSEADISDLKNEIDHGRTVAETASFLCRDVYEVRAKMKELRLTEQPSKRRVVL